MFQGEFSNNMDDKGRVSIPAVFRDALRTHHGDDRLIITRTPYNPCLVAYPLREWKKLQGRIAAMRPSPELRAFKRIVISSAQEYAPDRQGRVLIPQNLREYSSIQKGVMFAGSGEFFEIWDKENWDRQLESDLALARNFELD